MGDNAFLDLNRMRQSGRQALLATVVRSAGPTYRPVGSSAVFAEDGEVAGAISGGCLEADILAAAAEIFAGGPPRLLTYDTGSPDDLVLGTGTGCGGRMEVLLAPFPDALLPEVVRLLNAGLPAVVETEFTAGTGLGQRHLRDGAVAKEGCWYERGGEIFVQVVDPPATLFLCGAGDDVQPVVALAAASGFRVVVVDHRPGMLIQDRFPRAHQLTVWRTGEEPDIPCGSYAVLMTHNYERDLAYLQAFLGAPTAYVGLLGAHARARQLVAALLAEAPSLRDSTRTKLRAPVGLDIGADGPQEIALAIVAELVAVRAGRAGRAILPMAQVQGTETWPLTSAGA
jgi:xanthine dehydrogenase accessory factor